jgi:hypothetical protein
MQETVGGGSTECALGYGERCRKTPQGFHDMADNIAL